MIEPCKRALSYTVIFLLAAVAAYGQRAAIGVASGETTDRFGGLPSATTAVGDINADFIVIQGSQKNQTPAIVAGGEIVFPADTTKHASEFSAYAGPIFHFGSHFSAGFHGQVHKILIPASNVNGQEFARYNMLLVEVPAVLEYKFSNEPRHAFLQAQVSPEFKPHFTAPKAGTNYPKPSLDHGYFIRGTAGYVFGKWYARASYETRYFKFTNTLSNPNDLNNWKTNLITVGVGVLF
ncbi:MAG TPA: hypothetical protein VKV39_01255 [Candidatus Sulfotelmatobacter sp.]|nr:hypothetical protein [Candidatus Sulfotelmatobacter sp.]